MAPATSQQRSPPTPRSTMSTLKTKLSMIPAKMAPRKESTIELKELTTTGSRSSPKEPPLPDRVDSAVSVEEAKTSIRVNTFGTASSAAITSTDPSGAETSAATSISTSSATRSSSTALSAKKPAELTEADIDALPKGPIGMPASMFAASTSATLPELLAPEQLVAKSRVAAYQITIGRHKLAVHFDKKAPALRKNNDDTTPVRRRGMADGPGAKKEQPRRPGHATGPTTKEEKTRRPGHVQGPEQKPQKQRKPGHV